MEQYIIVKVRDAKACIPDKPVIYNGSIEVWPHSNLAKIRRAIHDTAEEQFISVADLVTHTVFMTKEESDTVSRIFNQAMARAKQASFE